MLGFWGPFGSQGSGTWLVLGQAQALCDPLALGLSTLAPRALEAGHGPEGTKGGAGLLSPSLHTLPALSGVGLVRAGA